ncbi:hypothetical protein JCM8097_000936 [Rhodosporidiobolus ruineniae]
MRPAGALRLRGGTRPRLPSRAAGPSTSPGYATLAPARPQIARPPSYALHPSFFLFHLSGITATSCLIPFIGARHSSSQAGPEEDPVAVEETAQIPAVPFDYPIQQPSPPPYQLLRLSNQLRQQIASAPVDSAFTLRQLHLVNQVPQLHLPDQSAAHPPSHSLANLLPERWVWRMPAAAALHSILRVLPAEPSPDSKVLQALLPIALTIAHHSLRFDSLVWTAVLEGRNQERALEWERLVTAAKAPEGEAEDLDSKPMLLTRLPKRRRERTADPQVELWQLQYDRLAKRAWAGKPLTERWKARQAWEREQAQKEGEETEEPEVEVAAEPPLPPPLPPNLHPATSIPTRTIDRLFLYIAQNPSLHNTYGSSAFSLALSQSNLARRHSSRAYNAAFFFALSNYRQDYAARFWVDFLAEIRRRRRPESPAALQLVRHLRKLGAVLRPEQRSFEATPSRLTLSAVATLTRALDEYWAEAMADDETSATDHPALSELIHLLAVFPPAPFAGDVVGGKRGRLLAKMHSRVERMVKEVFKRILEDVVQRDIGVGPVSTILGPPRSDDSTRRLPLTTYDYNSLISYALFKRQSPELASLVLERMSEQGHSPSASTHNIVFAALEGGGQTSLRQVLDRNLQNERTLPTYLTHLARAGAFDDLDSIVFQLLPELDHSSTPSDPTESSSSFRPASSSLPAGVAPPSTGRSPYLYTTLLYALACAGRIGLAERVFRNARWAAELSRAAAAERANEPPSEAELAKKAEKEAAGLKYYPPKKRRGWVLPPHAYTIMLQMYAGEVRRGRQLEQTRARAIARGEPTSGASTEYVRGWGRHALRVFLLKEQQAKLEEQLGASSASSTSSSLSPTVVADKDGPPHLRRSSAASSRTLDLPPFLRADAAPLVAIWELEGGSRGPELESLAAAMRSDHARGALRVLFPQNREEQEAEERRAMLREMKSGVFEQGRRAGKDTAKERERARAWVMKKRELERREKEARGAEVEGSS